jgi:hypothetical protein
MNKSRKPCSTSSFGVPRERGDEPMCVGAFYERARRVTGARMNHSWGGRVPTISTRVPREREDEPARDCRPGGSAFDAG